MFYKLHLSMLHVFSSVFGWNVSMTRMSSLNPVLGIFLVVVTVGTQLKSTECSAFTTVPRGRNVTLNFNTSFICEANISVFGYVWRINNVTHTGNTVNETGLRINNEDQIRSELFVLASMDRNMSLIECGVTIDLINDLRSFSPPAVLQIQGLLHSVTNLLVHSTSTSITLSWDPPFSLDITGVDPDFTHTVEVYDITSGEKSLVDTFQNIIDSTFTLSLVNSNPSDLFEFIVYAVNVVGEGEPSQPVRGRFALEERVTTSALVTTEEEERVDRMSIPSTTETSNTEYSNNCLQSESVSITIAVSITTFVVGIAVGSVISLLIVLMVVCVRRHSQQSTALETESGDIEMKSCDAYNVVAKKQKPPPPMYEEVDL